MQGDTLSVEKQNRPLQNLIGTLEYERYLFLLECNFASGRMLRGARLSPRAAPGGAKK